MGLGNLEAAIRQSVGRTMRITFGNHTELVFLTAVDPDGFLCRIEPAPAENPSTEFWVSYREVSAILPPSASEPGEAESMVLETQESLA
jgi:hypothetical protein